MGDPAICWQLLRPFPMVAFTISHLFNSHQNCFLCVLMIIHFCFTGQYRSDHRHCFHSNMLCKCGDRHQAATMLTHVIGRGIASVFASVKRRAIPSSVKRSKSFLAPPLLTSTSPASPGYARRIATWYHSWNVPGFGPQARGLSPQAVASSFPQFCKFCQIDFPPLPLLFPTFTIIYG